MTKLTFPDNCKFSVHPLVKKWNEEDLGGIDLGNSGINTRHGGWNWGDYKYYPEFLVYEIFITEAATGRWTRIRMKIGENTTTAEVFAWCGYGWEGRTEPLFTRSEHFIAFQELGSLTTGTLPLDTAVATQAAHGQACSMQSATYDFVTKTLTPNANNPTLRWSTTLTPSEPRQPGGNYLYMGLTFPTRTAAVAKAEYYPTGNYPGYMVNPDGTYVTPTQFTGRILHEGEYWHPGADDPGKVIYTDPGSPWADRADVDQNGQRWIAPDIEHYVFHGLAQAYIDNPGDEGLAMLVEAAAYRTFLQKPMDNRGTTHHIPGQARSQGRHRTCLYWIQQAIEGAVEYTLDGLQKTRALSEAVHAWSQLNNTVQIAEALRQISIRSENTPWPWFETEQDKSSSFPNGRLGHAPHEISLWGYGVENDLKYGRGDFSGASVLLAMIAEYAFESFIFDNGEWKIPYKRFINGPAPLYRSLGTSHVHFSWRMAMLHVPRNATELTKWSSLLPVGETIPLRWRG